MDKFLDYCKMTCLEGSEKGLCECTTPNECLFQNHPDYKEAREKAKQRMIDSLPILKWFIDKI